MNPRHVRTLPRLVPLCFLVLLFAVGNPASAQSLSAQDAGEIAVEAYTYYYPIIMMDVTRRQMTNVEAGKIPSRGPMNQFVHSRAFPSATAREVVRPNFDTLYSLAWLDLTKEPMIVSVPDTGGRYYMLPMMDMWTDVFAVVGTRTTGNKAGAYAVVGPAWKGALPENMQRIDSPTPYVWIIGRTQTNGKKDYKAVHKVQDGFGIVPLSQWGKKPMSVKVKIDPSVDMKTPPMEQVNKMPASGFFKHAAELMKVQPPHITDQPIVARMKHIGIEAGKSFDPDKADPLVRKALEGTPARGQKLMNEKLKTLVPLVNGWQIATDTMGVYGTSYLRRAIIAMIGLGANLPEDSIYPMTYEDHEGKPLDGSHKYVLHFDKTQLPPVDAFWSVTLYDNEGYQVANSIDRFALGDRDALKFNPDGSLDLFVQNQTPGSDKEANWLPAPKGPFNLTMRLYDPRPAALNGTWVPSAVKRME